MKYYITCVQKQINPYGIYEDEERLRELVVCKDCKWQGNDTDCPMFDPKMMKVDDFCSYGERKEE